MGELENLFAFPSITSLSILVLVSLLLVFGQSLPLSADWLLLLAGASLPHLILLVMCGYMRPENPGLLELHTKPKLLDSEQGLVLYLSE